MRLHNFFIDRKLSSDQVGSELTLPDAGLAHQLKSVFRFRAGDKLVLLDNSGFEYVSHIVSLEKERVTFHIDEQRENGNKTEMKLVLFQSLIKKDKFEWVLEKGTELGVSGFVPVISERSEKKDINMERCRKIMKEASEQSNRALLPELSELVDLMEALTQPNVFYIAFDPKGQKSEKAKILKEFDVQFKKGPKGQLGILVGPEGGWSEKELALFNDKKISVYSLGTQVLKAETAAISAAALFLLEN